MTQTVEIPVAGDYRIDLSRSEISFTAKHMFGTGTVRGAFQLREGTIHVADPVRDSSAQVTVAADSFKTNNNMRDSAVRSGLYLQVDKYPDITFSSTGLEETDKGWVMRGNLQVRAETRPIELHVETVQAEQPGLTLRATCKIDRYEFGLTKQKGMTGRYIQLTLDITASK